jgi:hypothetical protein
MRRRRDQDVLPVVDGRCTLTGLVRGHHVIGAKGFNP